MTLILALACPEGIVLASDSQETVSVSGQPVRQTAPKLFSLGSQIAWGASGAVGLRQKVELELQKLERGEQATLRRSIDQLRPVLVRRVVPVLQEAEKYSVPRITGSPPATLDLVFCGYTAERPWILEIARNGADEQHEHRGLCAVGSGDIFAYFASTSLAHYDIKNRSFLECQVLAYRVLDSAIEAAGFGLGLPIQMYLIQGSGVKSLTPAELHGLGDLAGLWKAAEQETLPGILKLPQDT